MRWVTFLVLVLVGGFGAANGGNDDVSGDSADTESASQVRFSASDAPLIVVDPGHGGGNTGAPGFNDGVWEKEVTLAIAQRLRLHLEARGLQVILTRDDDRYLSLRQRVQRANQVAGDLMVSIHANAAPGVERRGFETFILTPEAADIDARSLRGEVGRPRPGVDLDTAQLVDEVERMNSVERAADVAHLVQEKLAAARPHVANRGVRQESMHVLLGATMPAILVEVGFLDDPIEGRELVEAVHQDRIAKALADAVIASLNL